MISSLKKIKNVPSYSYFSWQSIKRNLSALIILFIIFLSSAYALFLIPTYFRYFNVNTETLLDSEVAKTLSSGWPQYQLIDRINKTLPEDAVVLVFRVADFAYYGQRKYVSYVDEKIADHVQQKTYDDVLLYLEAQSISHIFLPPYPIPSLYNSQIEKLLASPTHSKLLYNFAGYKLFELRKPTDTVNVTHLIGEDFIKNPQKLGNWLNYPQKLKSPISQPKKGILITGTKALLSGYATKPLVYRGKLKYRHSPLMNKMFYGFKENGIYSFTARLIGKGYLEVFLESYKRGGTGKRGGTELPPESIPLWAGVLNGNKRDINALFAIMPNSGFNNPFLDKDQAYRLVFRLNSGEYTRIDNWSFNQVNYSEEMPFQIDRNNKDRLNVNGWGVSGEAPSVKNLHFGLRKVNGRKIIFFQGQSSHKITLSSPVHFVPADIRFDSSVLLYKPNWQSEPTSPIDPLLNQALQISFDAKGHGAIIPKATITCEKADGKVVHVTTFPFVLAEQSRKLTVNFFSPCRPKFVQMKLDISPDRYSALNKRRTPPSLTLQNLSMRLRYVDMDRKVNTVELREVALPVGRK